MVIMRKYARYTILMASALLGVGALGGSPVAENELKLWQKTYAGAEAKGEWVLGLWQFQPGAEAKDASGKGHDLKLRGDSTFNPDGRFGACLESFGPGSTDKANGALVSKSEGMTPPGAFTLELWIKPKPELHDPEFKTAYLVDKMYINYKHAKPTVGCMRDYALTLVPAAEGKRALVACLGFGDAVARYTSTTLCLETGRWHHVAFSYDGAGEGRFTCDGEAAGGGSFPKRKSISPGNYPLVIGDRVNSSYGGFPGYIGSVRLSSRVVRFHDKPVALSSSGRSAFMRMEKDARVEWTLTCNQEKLLRDLVLVFSGEGMGEQRIAVPFLKPDKPLTFSFVVETSVHPGEYTMSARAESAEGKPLSRETPMPVTILPRPLPHRMPVVMWGRLNMADEKGFARRREIGFTHSFVGTPVDYNPIWRAGKPVNAADPGHQAEYKQFLDQAARYGHGIFLYPLSPAIWLGKSHKEFQRVGRDGKPYVNRGIANNPCCLSPGIEDYCYNVGASAARSYGAYPAWQAALIHTEVRDNSQLCFHDWDRAAFKAYAGIEMPGNADDKYGVHYKQIGDFPADRIIPDDMPLLTYYRWYWKQGDGWNQIHSAVSRGLKSTGRNDLWTWYDPAVRVPSVWGSGGDVDVIAQWTYAYPDPVRIAQATDELFAMADGAKVPQKVMKMTQLIWYRSQTAPKPKPGEAPKASPARWEQTDGDADFISIPPDPLKIAFWTKIARPIQGIMYHDWPALVDTGSKTGYRYTNPDTQDALAQLIHDVVQPLEPALMQVPDRKSDVGFLQSFASQMLAGRNSWGWSDDDLYLALQYAHLQPRILYEETVLKQGLDDFKVLVLSGCDVLPRSVADKVIAFQRRGGLIIADEYLAPAIVPDIRMSRYVRTKKADVDKAVILAQAAALRKDLDPFYQRYADSSNPEVVVRARQAGTTDYLFAVNDCRTFGDYVGQHGLVMEKGLPATTTLAVSRASGHVYDLVAGKSVSTRLKDGRLEWDREFDPAGGTVLMITENAIAKVLVELPDGAKLGKSASVKIAVCDNGGTPIDATIPVLLEISDAKGVPAEFSGYYGAKDGHLEVRIDLAANDTPGPWRIRVKELASGLSVDKVLQVDR